MLKKIYAFIDLFEHPYYLAGMCLAVSIGISTFGMALGWINAMETYHLFPWMIAAAMLLCYSFYTGITLVVSQQPMRHWSRSIYGFGAYVVCSGLFAWALSGKSIYEAGAYKAIYIVLTLSFFVFLGIGTSVKAIVAFTNKKDKQNVEKYDQDENQLS